jgi:hypothetical protein
MSICIFKYKYIKRAKKAPKCAIALYDFYFYFQDEKYSLFYTFDDKLESLSKNNRFLSIFS